MKTREIKFRAWDKRTKTMFIPVSINLKYEYVTGDDNYSNGGWDGDGHFKKNEQHLSYLDLMQYTGLKDKNDKEIYEGDVLLADDRRLCEVMWHDLAGMWDTKPISDTLPNNRFNELTNSQWDSRCEVIGNIHADPDLINEKQLASQLET